MSRMQGPEAQPQMWWWWRRVQGRAHGKAEVLKCLVSFHEELTEQCRSETSRAVRMAFWEYKVWPPSRTPPPPPAPSRTIQPLPCGS